MNAKALLWKDYRVSRSVLLLGVVLLLLPYVVFLGRNAYVALRFGAAPKAASDLPARQGPLNGLLRAVFGCERHWLPTRDQPFGVSALAVAVRPAGETTR